MQVRDPPHRLREVGHERRHRPIGHLEVRERFPRSDEDRIAEPIQLAPPNIGRQVDRLEPQHAIGMDCEPVAFACLAGRDHIELGFAEVPRARVGDAGPFRHLEPMQRSQVRHRHDLRGVDRLGEIFDAVVDEHDRDRAAIQPIPLQRALQLFFRLQFGEALRDPCADLVGFLWRDRILILERVRNFDLEPGAQHVVRQDVDDPRCDRISPV